PNGTSVKLTADPAAAQQCCQTVPPLGSVAFVISANLPLAGEYSSSLSLIYGKKRHPIALKITRTTTAPSVRLDRFSSATEPRIRFSITETSGADVNLRIPVVTSLARKEEAASRQADRDGARFLNDDCTTDVREPLHLSPNATLPFCISFPGLSEQGE